jgi:osmotically-inducible protein OsmY
MTRPTTPTTLRERVRADLDAVALGSAEVLSVAVDDHGRVILDGVVHSFAHHSAALSTARSAPGVRVVEDLIKIRL